MCNGNFLLRAYNSLLYHPLICYVEIGCEWNNAFTSQEIFIVAIFIGFVGSAMLIISLSLTADLIGQKTESSAFIYGFMSLLDKLSNGWLNISISIDRYIYIIH